MVCWARELFIWNSLSLCPGSFVLIRRSKCGRILQKTLPSPFAAPASLINDLLLRGLCQLWVYYLLLKLRLSLSLSDVGTLAAFLFLFFFIAVWNLYRALSLFSGQVNRYLLWKKGLTPPPAPKKAKKAPNWDWRSKVHLLRRIHPIKSK